MDNTTGQSLRRASEAPAPPAEPRREANLLDDRRRARWARWLLLAFALGGFFLFRESVPSTLSVTFGVPPTLYRGGVATDRAELTGLDARFFDEEGDEVARSSLAFPGGLSTPITPTVSLTIPAGRYLVRGRFSTRAGRALDTAGALDVGEESRARIALE